MNFLDNLILATLNEWQGKTLHDYEIAEIIKVSDINRVRRSLEMLTKGHYPVIKTNEGYTIPNNKISSYISGIAILTVILSVALFI